MFELLCANCIFLKIDSRFFFSLTSNQMKWKVMFAHKHKCSKRDELKCFAHTNIAKRNFLFFVFSILFGAHTRNKSNDKAHKMKSQTTTTKLCVFL